MPSGKIKQKWIIDFDDLTPTNPGLDYLIKMKEHYPNFKCTCFAPAFNSGIISRKVTIEKFKEWWNIIKKYDWIEVAPHGFIHQKGECLTKDRKSSLILIRSIENILKEVGIPFVKVFKAPYWLLSEEMEKVLHERGYTIALDRNNPVCYTNAPKYVWNWSIETPIPNYHTIKGHGHMFGTNNGVNTCLPNLLKIPQNAEFLTIGEYLKL